MKPRLLQLWQRLQLDPRKASLSWLLAGINVAIVLLVVIGISVSAVGLLRDLADEQALARVQLAGATAREELRHSHETLLTDARALATRPTLQRLLQEGRTTAVAPLLTRTCETERTSACALMQGTEIIAQSAGEIPWADILTAIEEQGDRFYAVPEKLAAPVMGAVAVVDATSNARLIVLRSLDQRLATTLSERAGLVVRLVNYRTFTTLPTDPFTQLHSAGLSDGNSAVRRIQNLDLYASSIPLFSTTGEAIALIETRLPAAEIDSAVQRLVHRLLISALILGTLALLGGIILGQLVANPLRALTDAAQRLAQGDFATSIPMSGAAEVGVLARTMEDMRRNLVEVTGTLRKREAEAQAVLGGIIEGVYAVDRNRNIRYLNPQAAKLLGVDAQEVIGKFCGDVLKPCLQDGRRPCETHCPIMFARTEQSAQATERVSPKEGNIRTTIITSAAPVDGLQVQVIRDETELEGVRRARDSVLANISHEFRTPLAAQLASIELLRDGLDSFSPEQTRELVLSLERGTVRLTRLIDNLLESVRIESGQLAIRHQSVGLAEIVEDADVLMGALLRQRRQHLEVSLPEDLPRIDGDGQRLIQVLVNLLANASKFAPEGSTIRIGAQAQEQRVSAWIEDEGPGIRDADASGIFERFSRGAAEEPEPGGLGLGLWIVRSIIERHGGTIESSRTPDARTRFTIELPTEVIE
jgi:signal transduction histidine kinase